MPVKLSPVVGFYQLMLLGQGERGGKSWLGSAELLLHQLGGHGTNTGKCRGAFKSSKSSGCVSGRKGHAVQVTYIFPINQEFTLIIYIFI